MTEKYRPGTVREDGGIWLAPDYNKGQPSWCTEGDVVIPLSELEAAHRAGWALASKEITAESTSGESIVTVWRKRLGSPNILSEPVPAPALSPAEIERLSMLAEEAGEIAQAVGKVLRHGWESRHPDGGPTNREALERELGDLWGVQPHMQDRRDLRNPPVVTAMQRKIELIRSGRYTHHQKRIET